MSSMEQSGGTSDEDLEPGVVSDETREEGLPPGSDTKGDDEQIPGTAGWGTPYEDAPAEGHLAPDADNPPP